MNVSSAVLPLERLPGFFGLSSYGRARVAASVFFLIDGLGFGTWASLIPSFKQKFALADASLSWVLLAMVVGALLGMPNERPAHQVHVDGFWMDATDVTNAEFAKFAKATGYVTTAERKPVWEELKKQLPEGTPKPNDSVLVAGSLVFHPTQGPVDLRNMAHWWTWTPGASWRHPEGPQSSIKGKDNYPVVQISWDDATAYAKWAGKRLPTEAEWEFASRGGLEKKRYAWGDEFMPKGKAMANTWTGKFPYLNTKEDGFAGLAPVKSFPANGYGLYDMGGNVWNWCSDWYRPDIHAREALANAGGCCFNPLGPKSSLSPERPYQTEEHVIKGGSFLCNPEYCESYRPSARRGTPPDTGSMHVGFRCVKNP